MRVRWLARALRNLREEPEYIARDNPQAAAQTVARIENAVELLSDQPAMGRPGRVPGTRELIIPDTPYIVPYQVRGRRVVILRVFHSSRRWPSSF